MKLRFENVRAVPDMTNEDYHNSPWNSLSNTRLKFFLPPTQERKYQRRFLQWIVPKGREDPLEFGNATHHLLLESRPVTEQDWHKGTCAVFEACEMPEESPTWVSGGELLWLKTSPVSGIVRNASDWGDVRTNAWRHDHDRKEEYDSDGQPVGCSGELTGFCAFADMAHIGDSFVPVRLELLGKSGSQARTVFKQWAAAQTRPVLPFGGAHGWERMLRLRREIRSSDSARRLLMDGRDTALQEYTLVGRDVDFGYEVRARMDRARIDGRVLHITDLKTTRDSYPKKWEKQCFEDHLPMQAYIMTQLAASCFGLPVEYKYVACGKGEDCAVEVFELDEQSIEYGGELYDEAIGRFHECATSGIWRSRSHGQVHRVMMPWYLQRDRRQKGAVRGTGAEGFYDD